MTAPCPASVDGLHDNGRRDGRCTWCGVKVFRAVPRPKPTPGAVSDLVAAYGYFYDPELGEQPL